MLRRLVWLARVHSLFVTPLSFHKIELVAENFCKLHFICQEPLILVIHVTISVLESSQVRFVFVINKSNGTQESGNKPAKLKQKNHCKVVTGILLCIYNIVCNFVWF